VVDRRFETNTHDSSFIKVPLTLRNCGALAIISAEDSSNNNFNVNNSSLSSKAGGALQSHQSSSRLLDTGTQSSSSKNSLKEFSHPSLGARVYVSNCRNTCKRICGWINVDGEQHLFSETVGTHDTLSVGNIGENGRSQQHGVSSSGSGSGVNNNNSNSNNAKVAAAAETQVKLLNSSTTKYSMYNSSANMFFAKQRHPSPKTSDGAGLRGSLGNSSSGIIDEEAGGDGGGGEDSENEDGDVACDAEADLLEVIVEERTLFDSFERAAATALWHGSLDLAVKVLREAAEQESMRVNDASSSMAGLSGSAAAPLAAFTDSKLILVQQSASLPPSPMIHHSMGGGGAEITSEDRSVEWDQRVDASYVQLVNLVGMCIAGYSHSSLSAQVGARHISKKHHDVAWVSMCRLVLENVSVS
jgi:hypothetical protein